MKIILYTVIDRAAAGGAQAVVARLRDGWRASGHAVVSAGSEGAGLDAGSDWVCSLFVRHGRARRWHAPSLLRAFLGLLRHRPDIVAVHVVTSEALYFVWLRRLFGYRLVLSAHGSDLLVPRPGCREALPELLASADAVTTVSRDLAAAAARLAGIDPESVHVVPNGVDCAFWTPAGAPPAEDAAPTFVSVGRLAPVKGLDLLIAAFAEVRARFPRARLEIIGGGEEEERLRALARQRGVADAVAFTGPLPPPAVRDRLRRAFAFVLPSRSEGMPLALIEAMATGLASIATRVGGVPEVLAPQAGVVVAPERADLLAEAMAAMLENRGRTRDAGRAAHRIAQTFACETAEAAYLDLFEGLAGPARGPARRGGETADPGRSPA